MVITLLTDLGYKDSSVGIVKGILSQTIPHANIIDITHDVMPFHILECSYLLKKSYRHFPDYTFHLCLFDIPLKNAAYWLLLNIDRQLILCPDNGVLPLSFPEHVYDVYKIPLRANSFMDCIHQISFVLAEWQNGGFTMSSMEKVVPKVTIPNLKPVLTSDGVDAQILHIDSYGNVVYNLQKHEFNTIFGDRKFNIHYSRHEVANKIVSFYEDASEGDTLFRFNDSGFLEFAVNRGSAAELYGLKKANAVQLVYSKISIRFRND